jgi:phosphoheptose isomerase
MTITTTFKAYTNDLNHAMWSVDITCLDAAARLIEKTIQTDNTIYVCGNGGSAAIANHLVCDCMKGISTSTQLEPRIVSLVSNVPLMTAIANDMSYNSIFSYQAKKLMKKGDILITISSSGNSPNIREALEFCHISGFESIAMCGFDGGASLKATIPLHVKSKNYGIVEDCHQSLMHMIAQYLRKSNLNPHIDPNTLIY